MIFLVTFLPCQNEMKTKPSVLDKDGLNGSFKGRDSEDQEEGIHLLQL